MTWDCNAVTWSVHLPIDKLPNNNIFPLICTLSTCASPFPLRQIKLFLTFRGKTPHVATRSVFWLSWINWDSSLRAAVYSVLAQIYSCLFLPLRFVNLRPDRRMSLRIRQALQLRQEISNTCSLTWCAAWSANSAPLTWLQLPKN